MMQKFDKMYTTKSTALQIVCRGKIEEIKLNNYSTIEEFFVKFNKSTNEFKSASGKLEEAEKLRYLLRALSPSYSYIGDFIYIIPEEERTEDYIKSKIKEKNMSINDLHKKNNVSTFTTKTKPKCFICGKIGHYKKDCWQGQQSNQSQQDQSSQSQQAQSNHSKKGIQRGFN